ncbi:Co2+/Mg2+ efflux protein ApaG [Comamonas sp. CMM02]|uniref:Co2+/Mg2+ efflux protein ApaG n=1 Tax=Comamonas sp. CMM02 TaxID=2769307 RepID=UPI00178757C6|nr:Co2+/Mg2+ efflux protein ApaG [Comamonas sp. CMM02]MBD9400272.1 Co2+/Mg2+ efflux protein ApaG [Comamonas sp. CMM02]
MPMYEFQVEARAHYEAQQSIPQQGVYRFAYTITVTNTGEVAAQLIARHWLITDAQQAQQEVHGLGVVGRQPLLQPGESFSYSSGCELRTDSGSMQGRYVCITEDGEIFDAPIAPFALNVEADPEPDRSSTLAQPSSRTLH